MNRVAAVRSGQKMELDEYQKQRMRENKQKMELYLVELEEIISQKREDLRIQEQEFERKAKKAQTEQLVAIDKLGKLQARIKKLELMILDLETKKAFHALSPKWKIPDCG